MKLVLFGATGMIGQGVLRAALRDPGVDTIIAVGRSAPLEAGSRALPKLRTIVHQDLFHLPAITPALEAGDACLFCLGVSSVGVSAGTYRRITYDLTLAIARALLEQQPELAFLYISGAGTDRASRFAWARVKAATEDALLALPFRFACMFRPGVIIPGPGIRSRTPFYRVFYLLLRPLLPVLRRFPQRVTTTEQLGRAMVRVAADGAPRRVLESADINRV